MSTNPKLPGGKRAEEELTRLKYYWRDVLSPAQKDFWRSRFNSKDTQAALRDEIRVKLKFDLKYDKQLTRFRKWDEMQQALDEEAEQQADDERRLTEQHPDWTKEQVREELLKRTYRRAIATGDFKLGLQGIQADRGLMEATTTRDKFEFDAAAAAIKHAATLNTIRKDSKLSEPEKVNLARKALFGVLPAQPAAPTK
jgi:hypothetical protein